MIIAYNKPTGRAVLGPEVTSDRDYSPFHHYTCVICGRDVEYTPSPLSRPFEFFSHRDGTEDCFAVDPPSDEHRLATEVTVKEIYNRAMGSLQGNVQLDVERWVGERSDFVITDVRMSSPVQIAVEVIYRCSRLALRRRFSTLFRNDYLTHLVCHTGGRYDPAKLEHQLQEITAHPVKVGRFDPTTFEVTLGSVFYDNMIDFQDVNSESVPKYLL